MMGGKKFANRILLGLCMLFVCIGFFVVQLPLEQIYDLPSCASVSYGDLETLKYKNISIDLEGVTDTQNTLSDAPINATMTLKAFGIFPIKRIKTKVYKKRIVFAGGYPLGMVMGSNGVLVIGGGQVASEQGDLDGIELKKGDIIKKINGETVLHISDIAKILKQNGDKKMLLTIVREGQSMDVTANPLFDTVAQEYKLGVWVKDKIAGLGTVSYVKPTGRYGALGHSIIDSDTNMIFPCFVGKAYDAKIVGCEKGLVGKPGALKGVFNGVDKPIGTVEKNNKFGVFGSFDKCDRNPTVMDVASRLSVKPGKASILSTVDDQMKEYQVQIVKASKQKQQDDKGMVVKITDKELLEKTGGILQGMSGSPILQDGKIVGALTHVFVNDPTKGYGMYLDFMLDN